MPPTKSLKTLPVGLHNVGTPNLYLQVSVNKNTGKIRRSWIYRYKSAFGWTRSMGLGSFKAISLKTAKELAEEQAKVRQLVTENVEDPIDNRRRARRLAKEKYALSVKISLKQVTEEFLENNGAQWSDSYTQKWRRMFERHLHQLNQTHVHDIGKTDVISALSPIFKNTPRQGKILQEHLETVLNWCVHKGYITTNPAKWKANLAFEFKNHGHKTEHMKSLPYKDAPAFWNKISQTDSVPSRAIRFIMLTAVRSGEATNATWDEFDLENKVWTIPASRMKMKKEHKVPLSDAAVALLKQLTQKNAHTNEKNMNIYVFPGRKPNEPISDTSLRLLKNTLNYKNITIHGLRATFRTWADEQTSYPHEVKEAALAHAIPSATEKAYVRGSLFEKRKQLLDEWAAYCTK